ncbi:unnamed protein product [Arctogadus glacialis]
MQPPFTEAGSVESQEDDVIIVAPDSSGRRSRPAQPRRSRRHSVAQRVSATLCVAETLPEFPETPLSDLHETPLADHMRPP